MSRAAPTILVEPSDYVLRNLGDMAMLQAAIERLQARLPSASIEVLTDDPEGLLALCPGTVPLPGESRRLWLRQRYFSQSLERALPRFAAKAVQRIIPEILAERIEEKLAERSEFTHAVRRADMLLVAGMGGITDYFADYARGVLRTLHLALRSGTPVALVGQGIGPLENPELRAMAAAVLPRAELIAARERRASVPLLHGLGVEPHRVLVTGDDAIEMAYSRRIHAQGGSIGLNLRLSNYSGVDARHVIEIGEEARRAAGRLGTSIVPLPVSHVPGEADIETARLLIADQEPDLRSAEKIATPSDLIGQVQRCRIVIAGSYHAGVFALANGIPVIAIAANSYYEDKFRGLADMFGRGCELVVIGDHDFRARLERAIDRLWDAASLLRPSLLRAAERQIDAGRAVYSKIADLVLRSSELRCCDTTTSRRASVRSDAGSAARPM